MPRGLNTDIWAPRVPNTSPGSASVSSAQAGRYSFTDSARTPKFTKNEAGESELLLGNHHLVALFIIIVCLVGILFTTGYIAGGRSNPVSVAKVASESKRETRPVPVRSSVHEATRTSEQPSAAPAGTAPQELSLTSPEKTQESATSETSALEKPATAPLSIKSESVARQTYLQLAATSQSEAGTMLDVLRKKGFNGLATEVPQKPGTFRVLVGPVSADAVNIMRSDLRNAGFPGDAAIKRTL